METIKIKLHKIESILSELKAPVIQYFNSGLSREFLIDFFNTNNIYANPILLTLYEWHNGVNMPVNGIADSIVEIFPNGKFYNLEMMRKGRELIIEWDYFNSAEEFIPIFGSGEDDIYLLNNTTNEIYDLSPGSNCYGEKCFKSIDIMLDFIIECYEKQIFTIDSKKGLITDYDFYFNYIESAKNRE